MKPINGLLAICTLMLCGQILAMPCRYALMAKADGPTNSLNPSLDTSSDQLETRYRALLDQVSSSQPSPHIRSHIRGNALAPQFGAVLVARIFSDYLLSPTPISQILDDPTPAEIELATAAMLKAHDAFDVNAEVDSEPQKDQHDAIDRVLKRANWGLYTRTITLLDMTVPGFKQQITENNPRDVYPNTPEVHQIIDDLILNQPDSELNRELKLFALAIRFVLRSKEFKTPALVFKKKVAKSTPDERLLRKYEPLA